MKQRKKICTSVFTSPDTKFSNYYNYNRITGKEKNTLAYFLLNICMFLAKKEKRKKFKIEGLDWQIRTLEVIRQIKDADS